MAAIRRPLKDPNHLALQELGWHFHLELFRGHSQRLCSISISFQGIKYLNTPWTTQLVHTGVNQSTYNTAGDPPSRISLSVFHIYWPPFSTWGLSPNGYWWSYPLLIQFLFWEAETVNSGFTWLASWPLASFFLSLACGFLFFSLSLAYLSFPFFFSKESKSLLFLYLLVPSKPIQHSPPARQARSQAITQSALTPTPRIPLHGTPAVPQLRAHLDRGPRMEGAAPSRKEGRGPRRSISLSGVVGSFTGLSRTGVKDEGEDNDEEEENSVEEEESDGT
ncbi:hypothetical protein O181_099278 [Austropuccinia psidii MF-1]|uniref:Uncharacterized protein n=1 Tax=Austropuccinia psidii MF-1 TaxID=1389203 RepID=A0A9Q3PEZ6_9BASI|nr:hypothetical protein [Austropuccinia psidii MF-1]